jgi:hypothetical protein
VARVEVELALEQVVPLVLTVAGGVVVLGLEGGPELDAGLEEGARFAVGLERAVQLGGSGAVAVAEQAVVFAASSGHFRPDRVGRQHRGWP